MRTTLSMKMALLAILIITLIPVSAAFARNGSVNSAGTGDAPTIQAGIDSASVGDTVTVASGTYYEHDIQMKSGILLTNVNSLAQNCIIDAEGQGRVMTFDGVDATTSVKYMTFTGGYASGTGTDGCGGGLFFTNYSAPYLRLCYYTSHTADNVGGAIYCEDHSAPVFEYGAVRWNQAANGGGGFACASNSSPELNRMLFGGNTTPGDGAGAHCSDNSTPAFSRCVFFNGIALGHGGGLYSGTGSVPEIDRGIFAFNFDGEGVYAADDLSIPTFYCSDIYGNEGGDWIDRIADQDSTLGNMSMDPLFCDTTVVMPTHGMWVEDCSPCLYGNHPYYNCGSRVGYIYEGCECGTATEPATWGTIKALYR